MKKYIDQNDEIYARTQTNKRLKYFSLQVHTEKQFYTHKHISHATHKNLLSSNIVSRRV
jgi:hypothetical protein